MRMPCIYVISSIKYVHSNEFYDRWTLYVCVHVYGKLLVYIFKIGLHTTLYIHAWINHIHTHTQVYLWQNVRTSKLMCALLLFCTFTPYMHTGMRATIPLKFDSYIERWPYYVLLMWVVVNASWPKKKATQVISGWYNLHSFCPCQFILNRIYAYLQICADYMHKALGRHTFTSPFSLSHDTLGGSLALSIFLL